MTNVEDLNDTLECDCGREHKVCPMRIREDRYVRCGCGRCYIYKIKSDKYVKAKL